MSIVSSVNQNTKCQRSLKNFTVKNINYVSNGDGTFNPICNCTDVISPEVRNSNGIGQYVYHQICNEMGRHGSILLYKEYAQNPPPSGSIVDTNFTANKTWDFKNTGIVNSNGNYSPLNNPPTFRTPWESIENLKTGIVIVPEAENKGFGSLRLMTITNDGGYGSDYGCMQVNSIINFRAYLKTEHGIGLMERFPNTNGEIKISSNNTVSVSRLFPYLTSLGRIGIEGATICGSDIWLEDKTRIVGHNLTLNDSWLADFYGIPKNTPISVGGLSSPFSTNTFSHRFI